MLEILVTLGEIESKGEMLSWEEVERVNKILRLRSFFGVNLTGSAIIVELMDKLKALEAEVKQQKADLTVNANKLPNTIWT